MSNLQIKNNLGDIVTICPYCNAHVILQLQVIDLNIYTNVLNNASAIILKKTFTQTTANEPYIKSLLINILRKKPFIARISTTKTYFDIITELTKTGFLTNKDLEKINNVH